MLVGMLETALCYQECYQVYFLSTKQILQVPDVMFIEDDGNPLIRNDFNRISQNKLTSKTWTKKKADMGHTTMKGRPKKTISKTVH